MHSQEIQHFRDDTDYNNSKNFGHIAEYITEIEFCGGEFKESDQVAEEFHLYL